MPVEDELILQWQYERRENGRRERERMRKQYVKTLELLRQSAFGSTEIYLRPPEVHHQHHSLAITQTTGGEEALTQLRPSFLSL